MRRIVRAAGTRAGEADPEQLAELIRIRGDLDEAIASAVHQLHDQGYTWDQIGWATGMTKQGAHKNWGREKAASEATAVDA